MEAYLKEAEAMSADGELKHSQLTQLNAFIKYMTKEDQAKIDGLNRDVSAKFNLNKIKKEDKASSSKSNDKEVKVGASQMACDDFDQDVWG
eukprot:6110610-Lingulodinium_polyedra.AAC.1